MPKMDYIRYYSKHKNFIIYTIVSASVSVINVILLYLFIDILKISTLVSGAIVVGGTFILKYFMFRWTGFTK